MTKRSRPSVQKKIEMLRRTQEINEIVERGSVEEQALLDSAGESRPADEAHVLDLLTNAQQQSSSYLRESRSRPKRIVRRSTQKRRASAPRRKPKRSRR
jgi:hypothetical protein